MLGLSLVAGSGGHSSSRCMDLSLSWPLLLRSTGSRRAGSVVVAHGPSCSAARGIFPDQGLNPCPLRWQADSQPLRHQGSPSCYSFEGKEIWQYILKCKQNKTENIASVQQPYSWDSILGPKDKYTRILMEMFFEVIKTWKHLPPRGKVKLWYVYTYDITWPWKRLYPKCPGVLPWYMVK